MALPVYADDDGASSVQAMLNAGSHSIMPSTFVYKKERERTQRPRPSS